jgi:HD-GYP domain-containing protein (c-di-GMP phosphodiesterase class II)
MPESAAIKEIIDNSGTQFDPRIADIFVRLINEGK